MRIGIDLDNCLNDLTSCWILKYNSDHNDSLTLEDIKSWDIHRYTKIGNKIYDYLDKDLLETLKPLPYAVEVTERLAKKHELFIVTASLPRELETKFSWIKRYYPHIPIDNIVVCQRKELIDVDVLIDDAKHNIIDFPKEKEVIIMDYPWNRQAKRKNSQRVVNWFEIEQRINFLDEWLKRRIPK